MADATGIVAGALGGLADAAQGQARGYIEDERKTTVAQQLSDIEELRQMRIAQASEALRRGGRQADFEQDMGNAPRRFETAAQGERVVGAAKNEVAVQGEKDMGPVRAANEGLVSRAKGKAELQNTADYATTPGARAGVRAKAQDQHIESSATLAQAELARLSLQERKDYAALVDQYYSLDDDQQMTPEEKKAAKDRLQRKMEQLKLKATGGAKDPELDTVRVTEESEDPDTGKKTKIEKTERRRPGNSSEKTTLPEAPRDMESRKVGTTYNTPRGPAIWRGNGWELTK